MKLYDISMPVSPTLPVYPGDTPVRLEPVTSLGKGDIANVSRLTISTHCGTHLDVPRHVCDDGLTVDQIPLHRLVGRAIVAEIHGTAEIDRHHLARLHLRGEQRVLLKTDNGRLWETAGFCEEYAALTPDAARYLADIGVELVGIDYLSVEPFNGDGSVHRTLLDAGALILEGLDLREVAAGVYEFCCLPLKLADGDGAPARAILYGPDPERGEHFEPHSSRWPLS